MNVITVDPQTLKKVKLSSLKAGEVFYFCDQVDWETAIGDDGGASVFIVTDRKKDDRISVVCLGSGLTILRDCDHKVVRLNAKLLVEL